jgi:hypothetical protein
MLDRRFNCQEPENKMDIHQGACKKESKKAFNRTIHSSCGCLSPRFSDMKRLRVFLLPLDRMSVCRTFFPSFARYPITSGWREESGVNEISQPPKRVALAGIRIPPSMNKLAAFFNLHIYTESLICFLLSYFIFVYYYCSYVLIGLANWLDFWSGSPHQVNEWFIQTWQLK